MHSTSTWSAMHVCFKQWVFLKLLKHTHLLKNETCLFPIKLNFFNIGFSFLTFQEPTFRIVSCVFSPCIVFGIPFSKSQVTTETANYILFTLKAKQNMVWILVYYTKNNWNMGFRNVIVTRSVHVLPMRQILYHR